MEIRRWLYYVLFNCVLIKYLEAKTISLNEVITAESNQKEAFETTLPPKTEGIGKRLPLIKRLKSTSRIKDFLKTGLSLDHSAIRGHTLSPLKYRKTFLIKSPLRPRKLNLLQKSRYKRKNQSAKREISGNESLKQKYIPLLKSLSMLFDNLLNSDESESYERKTKKFKRNRFYSEETFNVPIKLTSESDYGSLEPKSQEKTITVSTPFATETSPSPKIATTAEAASKTANFTATRNFGSFRQHKNIPLLLTRNTFSNRRVDNGVSKRSGTSLHGDIERNITGHYGDYEHAAGVRENVSSTENDEKNTYSDTRSSTGSFRHPRPSGHGNNTGLFQRGIRTVSEDKTKNASVNDSLGENQFKNRRNETKSPRILQKSVRRLRGFASEDNDHITEHFKPKEIREEGDSDVTYIDTGYQRITDGGSTVTKEDQKVRQRDETMKQVDSAGIFRKPSFKRLKDAHSKVAKKDQRDDHENDAATLVNKSEDNTKIITLDAGLQSTNDESSTVINGNQKDLESNETITTVDNSAGIFRKPHAYFKQDGDATVSKNDHNIHQRNENNKLVDIVGDPNVLNDRASYQSNTNGSGLAQMRHQKVRQGNDVISLENNIEDNGVNVNHVYEETTDEDSTVSKDQKAGQEQETITVGYKSTTFGDITPTDTSNQQIVDGRGLFANDQKADDSTEIMTLKDKSESNKCVLLIDQPITKKGSLVAKENQKGLGNEINRLAANVTTVQKKTPVVMIFDGYSIARHKNGENKFSEKSIRVRS
ncbi:uncharacterized protein LOC124631887 [Helicoverpa zea]|uniref:uncharacterized protein LOC124631887 n=1 Tax=Helicoverpa zea TaxID=7113 RepID=UPI001F58B031|nr:uncharacterized protein LOC124631887 [Helicoverpa zea]